MNEEMRIKDERDEDGNGVIYIERRTNGNSSYVWALVARHTYYNGELQSVGIFEDTVKRIGVIQYTDKRVVWKKSTVMNKDKGWKGTPSNCNHTVIHRVDKPLKRDC